MIEVEPSGYYVGCLQCQQELRINRKYVGQQVACKFCNGKFLLQLSQEGPQLTAFYSTCPHCSEELRVAAKYLGNQVSCKLCGGRLHLIEQPA